MLHYNYIERQRLAASKALGVAMLGLRSGSIGLLSPQLLVCTQLQTTSHQMVQSTKSSQKTETSKGLSDINATAETCTLCTHLQNIKHAHRLLICSMHLHRVLNARVMTLLIICAQCTLCGRFSSCLYENISLILLLCSNKSIQY